ncbi:MAG: hypothetical protein QOD74_1299 [Variibacter sp.]|jgi:protein-disulfide isomerase|nr:hypothetical protein [Variibacter sp.]
MRTAPRLLACATVLAFSLPTTLQAQTPAFSPAQQDEIRRIVKDYLIANPEVLQEAVGELEKRQAKVESDRSKEAVSKHRDEIFNSTRQVTLGNPNGDVTLVEFFDYNCGYCKRALNDMQELLQGDPNLRVVLKEFPVLGPASLEAAQIAVAVRMQDKSGKKYLDFHQRLLTGRGQVDKARALTAAKEAGADMTRLDKDLKDPEIRATLEETMKLAEVLGMNGTPSYVVGNTMIAGAVGSKVLKEHIQNARRAN